MTTYLTHLSVAAAGKMLRAREISPVELVGAFLARIERVDARIKSYLLVTAEAARARAKDAEAQIMAGGWREPLHGIPHRRGHRPAGGSRLRAGAALARAAAGSVKLRQTREPHHA